MIGLPTWAAWGSASGWSYRLKSLSLGFWSAGVCKMVWLLAGQTYLITRWAVRRWTTSAAAVSAHPCSYRRLIILRLVALCSFSWNYLELRERFPHSRWCYCPPRKAFVLEMFWIIKQSSPLHLVLERTLYILVILWPWASGYVKSQFWAIKDAKMRRKKQGKGKGALRKISPLSSSQCPTYHERSSDPFKRFI